MLREELAGTVRTAAILYVVVNLNGLSSLCDYRSNATGEPAKAVEGWCDNIKSGGKWLLHGLHSGGCGAGDYER